jgi:hypothetical protein
MKNFSIIIILLLYDNLPHKLLESTKVFEKIQIKWFSPQDMKKHRNKFRHFYREVIDCLIDEVPQITNFIKDNHRKQNKEVV